jgi:hypothetical protein
VGEDDPVVENDIDVGLSGEAAEGGGVVLTGGLDGGDAEMFVAMGEAGSGGCDAGFGVAGDRGVAIKDEVAVWGDAGRVDL